MKKLIHKLVISFLLVFGLQGLNAQLYPIFGSYTFLEFVDAQSGWAGDAKRLMHTSDGGKTWEVQLNFEPNSNMYLDYQIMSIHFISSQFGILNVVDKDYNTYIFRTEDGGSNWEKYAIGNENIPPNYGIQHMDVLDELNCFGAHKYNNVIGSTDGGKSWNLVYEGSEYIRELKFVNKEIGYVNYSNRIAKTVDGGITWTEISFDGSPYFTTLDAIGSKVWVSDQGTGLYFSEDGGENWSLISDFGVTDLNMIDEYFGIASNVYVTNDGGATWDEKLNANLSSFINPSLGWIISPNAGIYAVEHIKKVTNDFQTFETQTPSNSFTDVVTVNESIIIATTTNGEIIRSINGGKTWSLNNDLSAYQITDICFNDANDGVLVGNYLDSSSNYRWIIANSSDAGENWEIVMNDTSAYGNTLHALDFATGSFRTINDGLLLVSHDNGKNWSEYSSDLPLSVVTKIIFIDDDRGFAIGANHTNIYKTINGGQNWSVSYEGALWDIAFSSEDVGWIARQNYCGVMKTLDQGNSWNEIEIGAERIYFLNPNFGIFSGLLNYNDFDLGEGTFKTGDGGANWEKISDIRFTTDERLSGIDYASEDLGFFVDRKVMYSTIKYGNVTDGTVSVDENKNKTFQPTEYSLSQNYPNPFNPSTVIEFIIPKKTNVSLRVYNSIGEEVAELLNGEMIPGYHSVNFNATSVNRRIPSGIYFYRISAGNFTKTNKMILLR